tara:strand:- start:2212 stop:2556 length:345 start_codon:yes stop_codon:yes gene_type:complete
MAKAPHTGSRKHIAEFIHDKVLNNSSQYKVIQPQALAFFNGTFWWVAKIVTIDRAINNIGIARTAEVGFVIVSESKRGKFKLEGTYMQKALPTKQTKSLVKRTVDVVKVERNRH